VANVQIWTSYWASLTIGRKAGLIVIAQKTLEPFGFKGGFNPALVFVKGCLGNHPGSKMRKQKTLRCAGSRAIIYTC
jgi:hypothetical protein